MLEYYYGEADSPVLPPATLITMHWNISAQNNIIPISSRMKPICLSHLMKTIIRLWQKLWKSDSSTGRGRVSMMPLWSPSDLAEAMMEYLDCECTYFPSMTDDDPHHVGIQLCQTGKCQRGLCAGFD